MSDENKTALVTDSSRGIGRAIAVELARRGYAVIVHGSRESDAWRQAGEEVRALNPKSIVQVADLSDADAIREMFRVIEEPHGRLDVLVNNAATQNATAFLELKEEDWDFVQAVNLKAPFLCGQLAGRMMRRAGGGKIVNITSVHAKVPKRNFAHYSSSKAGLDMLTMAMAMELAEFNIQVNSIVCGAIATDMTPADRCENLLSSIPAGRIGTVEETARLAAFLASHECDYLTGASITLDGGLTLGFCATRPDL
ncbi:MAG: 3-oxoacyl-ACP reductase FabG [Phycisphaerae bacterium]|nr:3-oxoacyl-ACP reductase FabG [Phycisphaerae bacterium]